MSHLLDALKKWTEGNVDAKPPVSSTKNIKHYSASVPEDADSVTSPQVRKRRLPDVSRLGMWLSECLASGSELEATGAPEWHAADPPPPPEMPGTASPSELPAYTMAHSTVMHATGSGAEPWLGLVLYSHAPATSPVPMYHNAGTLYFVFPAQNPSDPMQPRSRVRCAWSSTSPPTSAASMSG